MAELRIHRFPGGLKVRMATVTTSLVVAVALAGAVIFTRLSRQEISAQFESSMQSLAKNLGRNAAYGVFVESGDVVRDLATNLLEHDDVVRVVIRNAQGKEIFREEEQPGMTESGEVTAPVMYESALSEEFAASMSPDERASNPRKIGEVVVTYSRDRVDAQVRATLIQVWSLTAVFALIASAVAVWLAQRMVSPLGVLNEATTRVASGDLDARVGEEWDHEIAALARSFNQMTDALRTSRKQLADTYGELARKDRLATLGQFTAVIAHELKNPLGVILSSAQIIANPKRTAEQKEKATQFIIEEVRRLNGDLTGFLNFARPKPPEIKPVDLGELAERAVAVWRTSFGSAERTPTGTPVDLSLSRESSDNVASPGVAVNVKVTPGTPLAAADRDQVHQVLLNLLINAAQAMSPREGQPGKGTRIDVSVRPEGTRVALCVEDDGPGMPDDVKAHAFEPFFTTKKRGSGLGLAVVEQVARAHGGSVDLESAPGKGTRFTLYFPSAANAALASASATIRPGSTTA